MLEKEEYSGAGPSFASPASLVIPANDARENSAAIVSGLQPPASILYLSLEITSSVLACPSEEL